MLALSLAFEGPGEIGDAIAGIDAAGLAALAFVALPSGLFGFGAWTALLKRYTAAAITPFALLVPVFGIASAALLLGERPSALELVGAALICAGLGATLASPRERARGGSGARAGLDLLEVGDVRAVVAPRRTRRPRTTRRGSPRARPRSSSAATARARWRRSSGVRHPRSPHRRTARRARRRPCWRRSRRPCPSSSRRCPARPGRPPRRAPRPPRPTPSRRAPRPRARRAGAARARGGGPRRPRRRRRRCARRRRWRCACAGG